MSSQETLRGKIDFRGTGKRMIFFFDISYDPWYNTLIGWFLWNVQNIQNTDDYFVHSADFIN